MSLSRQLVLLVITLVMLLFAGTFLISVYNTRDYLESQLASHAQDAATSLGLSATTHVANGDRAMFTAMVNAMIHRGDYLNIRIEDLKGQAMIEREAKQAVDVPEWFVYMFPLHSPEGSATMMSGWQQLGTVKVVSHPGLAYRKLWENSVDTLSWFIVGAGVVLLAGLFLLRMMLRPLERVAWQAHAICNREFPVVEEQPFTLEFRKVVEAMNRLSLKVGQMLDNGEQMASQLREQANTDPLTGLFNRRHFMNLLQTRLEDKESCGAVLLLQIENLAAYNQAHGYQGGDRLLRAVASLMKTESVAVSGITLAHLSGGDFAVLYEGAGMARTRELAERLARALGALYVELEFSRMDVGHVGGALYQNQTPGEMLSAVDMALRHAQQEGPNALYVLGADGSGPEVFSAGEWRTLLEQALDKDLFRLQQQPVYARGKRQLLHRELFLRLVNPESEQSVIPAGVFMPMAESLGLAAHVDRWVITEVVEHVAAALGDDKIAINMASTSLAQEGFIDWLDEYLRAHTDSAKRLILEWTEYGATVHLASLKIWIERLTPLGVEFSLDHFGKGFSSFAAIRELKAHYLKIDGSFTRDLDEAGDNAFFLQAVANIAHGLDLAVIAESVESAAAWERLESMDVDGGRGYWLGDVTDVRS